MSRSINPSPEAPTIPLGMARREREILEHTVHSVAEQAIRADEPVEEATAAGGADHPITIHAKMLRLEEAGATASVFGRRPIP